MICVCTKPAQEAPIIISRTDERTLTYLKQRTKWSVYDIVQDVLVRCVKKEKMYPRYRYILKCYFNLSIKTFIHVSSVDDIRGVKSST